MIKALQRSGLLGLKTRVWGFSLQSQSQLAVPVCSLSVLSPSQRSQFAVVCGLSLLDLDLGLGLGLSLV